MTHKRVFIPNRFKDVASTKLKESRSKEEDSTNWEKLGSGTVPFQSKDTTYGSILDGLNKIQTCFRYTRSCEKKLVK